MKLEFFLDLGEEASVLVYRNDQDLFELWDVPQYGGDERYYKTYNTLDEAIGVASSEKYWVK